MKTSFLSDESRGRFHMGRVLELVEAAKAAYPADTFFDRFAETCREIPAKHRAYRSYEDALRYLDPASWQILKTKAVSHFCDHRRGQLKQGFFNQLNEALAYRHLVRPGNRHVRALPEQGSQVPDLEYYEGRHRRFCEVKTLGISDREIARRDSREVFTNAYPSLGDGFIGKLRNAIALGRKQIEAQNGEGLVYVVVTFDDIAQDYYRGYRRELAAFAKAESIDEVYLRFGVRFNRRMRLTSGSA